MSLNSRTMSKKIRQSSLALREAQKGTGLTGGPSAESEG